MSTTFEAPLVEWARTLSPAQTEVVREMVNGNKDLPPISTAKNTSVEIWLHTIAAQTYDRVKSGTEPTIPASQVEAWLEATRP